MTGVPILGGAADLSPDAIAARARAEAAGLGRGGLTGAQLIQRAGAVLDAAHRAQRIAAKRRGGRRQAAAERRGEHALLTAAVQIRIASIAPLHRPYLHHLTVQQLQAAEHEARAMVANGTRHEWGVLAVDTHRRVAEQRARLRQEHA